MAEVLRDDEQSYAARGQTHMELYTPFAFLFGSPPDWIVLMAVALIFLGPKKLPEVGKQLGHAMREFRKMTDELTGAVHSIREEVESAYEPVIKPYSGSHATSSPTVEAATKHRTYDQAPEDLMAPVVPELRHGDGTLLIPPPAVVAAPGEAEKGQGN